MQNQSNSSNKNSGVFGWGWSSLADLRLLKDSFGNVAILNLTSIQTILPQRSHLERTFELQANGSYQGQIGDKGILTQEGERYQLKEKDGTIIFFRADGQLDYVQNTNGYRLTAGYSNDQLTNLTASNGDSITFTYNAANCYAS